MALWIHFTDSDNFDLAALTAGVHGEFPGLFVYRYSESFPVAERSREWGHREAVIVECDENLVKCVQPDPLGDDETRDEYLIPPVAFDRCDWWWL